MASYKKTNCPSCGAPAENVDRFAAMAVCEYCGSAFYFEDESVLAMGKMAIVAETQSPFYVGATGSLSDKRFTVVGRLRYRWEGGFWDEWCMRYDDDSAGWISEDEGEFSTSELIENPGEIPPFDLITPGQVLIIGGREVLVDEKHHARLEGAEGSIPFKIEENTEYDYVDASQGDDSVCIEYLDRGVEVYLGRWVDFDEIELDNPRTDYDEDGW